MENNKNYYLVISDVHQYENNVKDLINHYKSKYKNNLKAILDCGDHDDNFYVEKDIPWYFIMGNHENKEIIEKYYYEEDFNIPNLFLIKPGDVFDIFGLKVAGFGGIYSEKTFQNKRKKTAKFYHIKKEDIKKMENIDFIKKRDVNILLMHESSKRLWRNYRTNFGNKIFEDIINEFSNLSYVFSGHYHIPNRNKFISRNDKEVEEISISTPEDYNHILLYYDLSNNKIGIEAYKNYLSLEKNFPK